MIIRTLSFTVSPTATEPQTVQTAGTMGDHLATRLEIQVPHTELSYRLEVTDGCGGYDITSRLTPDGDRLFFDIPCSWTAAGIAAVRVVALELDGEHEVMRYHYPPFYLQFEEREDGEATGDVFLSEWQETLTTAEFLNAEFERRMLAGEFKGEKGDKGDKGDTQELFGEGVGAPLRLDYAVVPQSVEVTVERGIPTASSVYRYGKNLFDFKSGASRLVFQNSSGETVSNQSGYAVSLPAGTYTFHAEKIVPDDGHFLYGYINDKDGAYVSSIKLIVGPETVPVTVTLAEGDVVYLRDLSSGNGDLAVVNRHFNEEWNVQVEVGTQATPYEPYQDEVPFEVMEGGVATIPLISATTTLVHLPDGNPIHCRYRRDLGAVIDGMIRGITALGGAV